MRHDPAVLGLRGVPGRARRRPRGRSTTASAGAPGSMASSARWPGPCGGQPVAVPDHGQQGRAGYPSGRDGHQLRRSDARDEPSDLVGVVHRVEPGHVHGSTVLAEHQPCGPTADRPPERPAVLLDAAGPSGRRLPRPATSRATRRRRARAGSSARCGRRSRPGSPPGRRSGAAPPPERRRRDLGEARGAQRLGDRDRSGPASVLDVEEPREDVEEPATGMVGRAGLGHVVRGAVLDQQHTPGPEDPTGLGGDGAEVGDVVDQGALEDDVRAPAVEPGGRRVTHLEGDAGQRAVALPCGVEDRGAGVDTGDGRGAQLVPGADIRRLPRSPCPTTSAATGATSSPTASRQETSASRSE